MPRDRCASPSAFRGFTLLEVLMVVLLVGIISSVVVMSVNTTGPERQLPEESARLATLLEQAANEAVMQNQELGLRVTGQGYVFLCLDEARQRWKPCADEIFRERELPDGLELHLLRQGSIKDLPRMSTGTASDATSAVRQRQEEEGNAGRLTPDLFLLSSGESSSGSLELRVTEKPEERSEISLDEVGRVQVNGAGVPAAGKQEGGDAARS